MDGVGLSCALCGTEFALCRRCWSGQWYCSERCSSDARRRSRRKAQNKYAKTPKGRASQRRRNRTLRLKKSKKIETDQTPIEDQSVLEIAPGGGFCRCCGGPIGTLLRITRGRESPFYFSFRRREKNGASSRYPS